MRAAFGEKIALLAQPSQFFAFRFVPVVAQCVLRYRSRNFSRIVRMSGCRDLAQTLAEENRLQSFPRQAYCIELAEPTRLKTSRKMFI